MSRISLQHFSNLIRIQFFAAHLRPKAYVHTTLAIECQRKQTDIPQNIILGHLRPMQEEDTQVFEDAAENTASVLAESWMSWSSGQQALSPSSILRPSLAISSTQTWKASEQQQELAATGLDYSVLSPFTESINEFNEHDSELFVPQVTTSLDPYSEEYHQALLKILVLDSPQYSHVDHDIPQEFKLLLRKYPTAFLLPGSSLGEIKYFQHHIDTENVLPVYKHPYRKVPKNVLLSRMNYSACSR